MAAVYDVAPWRRSLAGVSPQSIDGAIATHARRQARPPGRRGRSWLTGRRDAATLPPRARGPGDHRGGPGALDGAVPHGRVVARALARTALRRRPGHRRHAACDLRLLPPAA